MKATKSNQPKMRAFLKACGIGASDIRYNEVLSTLNRRPVFDALDTRKAVEALTKALGESTKYFDRDMHLDVHEWRLPGLGKVSCSIHRIHPGIAKPIWVTPVLRVAS